MDKQVIDTQTDRQTHTQTQATTIPEGQNWPRVKFHLPIAESRTGKPAMVTLKIQLDCFTVHDTTLWANIFVRSHLGCGTDSVFICFCRSHKHFKDAKVMQINRIFEKLNLTNQAQSTPKTIGILTKVFCNSGSNLVILA